MPPLSALVMPTLLAAHGADPALDKGRFSLLDPTPRELMREMSTDRPDTTESPFTLDAGHVQVELSLVDFTRDSRNGVRARSLAVGPMLIKVGLTNSVDLQLGIEPYTRVRTEDAGAGTTLTIGGFGDTALRLKVNLFGNDSTEATDGWALAVMPFVTFPTARDGLGADRVEGGVIVPAAVDLCEGWSLGLMAELDVTRDGAGSRYVYDFVHTATVAHDLTEQAGLYVEYAGFLSLSDEEEYRAYFNAGATYALSGDVQLDIGLRIGLTDAADDFGVFTGLSLRF